ncbi:MAG: MoaD/ThiS family protein [Oscillospiraceae bacterium]|nr:MoaD/ThiS family protein [Oscillospiraceae bacterium]
MKIQVRSALYISKILAGRKIFVELSEQSTLGGLLRQLTDIYGQEFYDAVCDGTGYRANKVAILVNGANIAAVGGIDIQLKDGDDVLILPVISGG